MMTSRTRQQDGCEAPQQDGCEAPQQDGCGRKGLNKYSPGSEIELWMSLQFYPFP